MIGIDMNEDVRGGPATAYMKKLGLTEIITKRHGKEGPRTCNRGSSPIDGIFVSAGLLDSPCGYLPFGWGDHRLLWVDLDLKQTFGHEADISPRFKPQRLQNDDPRTRDKYLNIMLQALQDELNFSERLDTLLLGIQEGVPLSLLQQQQYDNLLLSHHRAAQKAEKECRKLCMGKKLWTPAFTRNRDVRLFWLKILAKRRGKNVDSKYLQRLAKKQG
jgi:hypothetical protein